MPETTADARVADVRLPRGVRLRYVEQGPASGDAVLMLHGFTDSSFSFSRVLPLLPPTMRVVALDQRGHGDSDRPERGYSMDDFALDAIELMDALKIQRATVVGHCMGSFIARRMAVLAPTRVARLVLIAAGPSGSNEPIRELASALETFVDPIDPAFVREFQQGASGPTVPPEFLERAVKESLKLPVRVWKAAIAGLMDYASDDETIACETLVVGGELDSVFSVTEQRALAGRIPGARLQLHAGIGHAPHWEAPELVAKVLSAAS